MKLFIRLKVTRLMCRVVSIHTENTRASRFSFPLLLDIADSQTAVSLKSTFKMCSRPCANTHHVHLQTDVTVSHEFCFCFVFFPHHQSRHTSVTRAHYLTTTCWGWKSFHIAKTYTRTHIKSLPFAFSARPALLAKVRREVIRREMLNVAVPRNGLEMFSSNTVRFPPLQTLTLRFRTEHRPQVRRKPCRRFGGTAEYFRTTQHCLHAVTGRGCFCSTFIPFTFLIN